MSAKRRTLLTVTIIIGLIIPTMAAATDRFADVPDANPFHDDIGWLADAGVTAGCNPPANDAFCPTDKVSREQMAAFMRRFAKFLGAEDGVVAEADTVDGYNASDLVRGAGAVAFVNTSTSPANAVVFSIVAPTDGGIVTNLSFACTSFSGTTNTRWDVAITVDGATESITGGLLYFNHAESATVFSSSASSLFSAVTAGSHDVGYRATRIAGDGSLDCDISETAVFVPFGSDGSAPAALTGQEIGGGTRK